MSSLRIRKLSNPTPAELDRTAKALSSAFEEDVFTLSCIGGNKDMNEPLQRACIAAAAVAGEIIVAGFGERDIVGAGARFGPGLVIFSTPEQRAAGLDALMGTFSAELSEWWKEYFFPKYEGQITKALGEGTRRASWNVHCLGVLPEHQGKGIGSLLMKEIESEAVLRGEALCLETMSTENVAMYKHWGYSLKSEEKYESSTGGFTLYVLSKDTKATA